MDAATLSTAALSSVLVPMLRLTVTDASEPSSPTLLDAQANATVAVSASVMVTFCEVVLPNVRPDEGLEMVNVAVSVPSTSVSSWMVKVTEPVLAPSRIVMVEAESVPSPVVMPVPETAMFTV